MRAFESIHFATAAPVPHIIVTGAVHGDETCGTRAIQRVLADIDAGTLTIVAGDTFVPVTNPLAYAEQPPRRRPQPQPQARCRRRRRASSRDHVANWLCPLLAAHEVLLDLHSFHARRRAVRLSSDRATTPGRSSRSRRRRARKRWRVRLGVGRDSSDGWLATYAGRHRGGASARLPLLRQAVLDLDPAYGIGTTEYMRSVGGCRASRSSAGSTTIHLPAPEVACRAIVRTPRAHLRPERRSRPGSTRRRGWKPLRLCEVVDKGDAGDAFSDARGASFDPVAGRRAASARAPDGTPLRAEADVRIVFPNPRPWRGRVILLAQHTNRFGG